MATIMQIIIRMLGDIAPYICRLERNTVDVISPIIQGYLKAQGKSVNNETMEAGIETMLKRFIQAGDQCTAVVGDESAARETFEKALSQLTGSERSTRMASQTRGADINLPFNATLLPDHSDLPTTVSDDEEMQDTEQTLQEINNAISGLRGKGSDTTGVANLDDIESMVDSLGVQPNINDQQERGEDEDIDIEGQIQEIASSMS